MEKKFLLAAHRALNLTAARFFKLKKFFGGNWEKIWHAEIADLRAAELDPRGAEKFLRNRKKISPDAEIEKIEKCGAQILVLGEKNFPQQLENIPQPPVILFCRGEILPTDFPSISVVGSRKITNYGRRAAEKIVGEIADAGISIISGLAFGADTVAHEIALAHNSRTIAVLGNGIDKIYPQKNFHFAEKFLAEKRGAILSEYFPGTEIRPENFPTRNRIVAGLSLATIVLEAADRSGTLITAGLAAEQGREIFAVPGEIFSKNSVGTNKLILRGNAHPAISGAQILEHLKLKNISEKKAAKKKIPTTEIEQKILRIFGDEKIHIDEIIRAAAVSGAVVSSNISILEIKGLIKNLGNQFYAKNF